MSAETPIKFTTIDFGYTSHASMKSTHESVPFKLPETPKLFFFFKNAIFARLTASQGSFQKESFFAVETIRPSVAFISTARSLIYGRPRYRTGADPGGGHVCVCVWGGPRPLRKLA